MVKDVQRILVGNAIFLSQYWWILVGMCCNLTWLSNELTSAVIGVTDASARLPSIPVLTSSSPSFPVPRLWHLILQSLCCKGNLNKLQPFLRLPGQDLNGFDPGIVPDAALFSSCCCHAGFQRSTFSSAGLAGSGPLVKACRVFGGEVHNEGGSLLWAWDLEVENKHSV